MTLNASPSSVRTHIGFFGKRNAGKSSIVNELLGQELSVVSEVAGTTTDLTKKAMELFPLGPVMIIDTPGFDDSGLLGEKRIEQTKKAIKECDIAVLIVDSTDEIGKTEKELIKLFDENETPYITVYSKKDLKERNGFAVSAKTGEGIEELKQKLANFIVPKKERYILKDFIKKGDLVVLVIPIDEESPKGRLILPQQQVIREIIEAGALALTVKDTEFSDCIKEFGKRVSLVVTDSQIFSKIKDICPKDIHLTSFSILMARFKGTLLDSVKSAQAIENLKDGDKVLISEACTHQVGCKDIGKTKIPKMIEKFTGKRIEFSFTQGKNFPEDLKEYALVIHCGGCMATEKEMSIRLKTAKEKGVPFTNYGMAIAVTEGILGRCIEPLPEF